MPPTTPAKPHGKPGIWPFGTVVVCLVGILAILFSRSFRPELTLFSNDGPLGVISSQADYAVSNFKAVWLHLNWVGVKSFSSPPNITNILFIALGNITFSKFYVPISLFILGLSAWLLFRQLGFRPWVCALGGLAIALNTDPFSYACWGLASLPLSMAGFFLALAALAQFPGRFSWLKPGLAGSALGLSLMEGYDNGAIFSLYTAAFVVFQSWNQPGKGATSKVPNGIARVVVVAAVAALASAHTLSDLFTTQVKGVAMAETKQERWNGATQWSLPKVEAVRLVVSGLFGYRMDTPGGGEYWGSVGRTPGWEEHHQGSVRHSGAGVYAGVLIVFIACWAAFQAFRQKSIFETFERRFIWFWSGAALVSLLLAFGRHAPFYQLIYPLPFFSTMRNPIKFIHPLAVAFVILFAFGLEGLHRRYLMAALKPASFGEHLQRWWKSVTGFDRRWVYGSLAFLGLSLLGWLIETSSRPELEKHLAEVGFDPVAASAVTKFSAAEVGWYVLYLALSVGAVILILSGWFAGKRAKWAAILLGLILVMDLARANSPWIIYYNYREDYASNPLIDLLRQKPYEHRVAARLRPMGADPRMNNYLTSEEGRNLFPGLYEAWLQSLFQYYQIQSPDIIQMPRMSQVDKTFLSTFAGGGSPLLIPRLWQLTSTRYVLGMAGFLDSVNQQLDPALKRFRIHTTFDFVPKPTAPPTITQAEQLTTAIKPDGQFALFEFTGALPRATLFAHWQVNTNDQATLAQLADPAFDPLKTVLVASDSAVPTPNPSTNQAPGLVEITYYTPKVIKLTAQATSPSVLLLDDHYDPDWHVSVNGKPAPLLRLNYLFTGVSLPAGSQSVEFRFEPRATDLYISLAVIAASLLACLTLAFAPKKTQTIAPATPQVSR